MNNDMKCPFCQQELQYDDLLCSCINEHCEESFDMVGTELLWQKVIDLKQEIDSTRKALDVAVDTLERIASEECKYPIGAAAGTIIRIEQINEITALEQKE